MSGVTGDNPYRASGVVAAAAAGGLSWQDVVTGSTLTAEAGNAYWIDTTSNACTITLPASASNGDEMIFADYDRTWGTYGIVIDSNGLNYQGFDDSYDVEYGTDGTALNIVYSDATNGWIPTLDKAVAETPSKGNDNGIFGFGTTGSNTAVTNLVSNTGVVATDTSGVGTARQGSTATEYGGDKGIFGYGENATLNVTNNVSNTGVVATDTTGVGSIRSYLGACEYGTDTAIFGFGDPTPGDQSGLTNLVSNTGVVATDTAAVGTARNNIMACSFGNDRGIFIGGDAGAGSISTSNLVSNTGVVATDTTGVGTVRGASSGTEYGGDKGIWAYGVNATGNLNVSNLISNTGVVATDTSGVGSARKYLSGCAYN